MTKEEILEQLDPAKYIGRCPWQVDEFIETQVQPILAQYYQGDVGAELTV